MIVRRPRPGGAFVVPGPLAGGALLLASCLSIQAGAALATTTFSTVAPAGAAGLRFALAAAVVALVVRPRVSGWSAARWRAVAVFGLAAAVNELCLYLALDRLPLGMAVTIEFLGPLGLAIVATRGPRHLAAALLALGGVALLSGTTLASDPLGVALAFTAAAGWAAYILASSRIGGFDRPLDSLAVSLVIAAAVTAPLTVSAAGSVGSGTVLLTLTAVAVLGTAVPYGLELAALRRLTAAAAGILFSIEPAIAAVVGFVALGQGLGTAQAAGIVAVTVAGALALRDAPD